jgi:uncharacterized protein
VIIEIENLAPEPLHVRYTYARDVLPFRHDDASLEQAVATDFVLTRQDRALRIEGTVQTAVRFQCARCLKEFSSPFDARFTLCYLPQAEWKENEEIELKYEDMDVAYYDGITFDVDLMVLEQIELAMPMKYVCREDCKGLCASCGSDLNEGPCPCKADTTDSRLAVLRDFRSKMNK